jgi:hypothetical protein
MTQINFDSALLVRREQGPDTIELTGKSGSGKSYCFQTEEPRGTAEDWLKLLGFTTWVERAPGFIMSTSGKKQPCMVDCQVKATLIGYEKTYIHDRAVKPESTPDVMVL